MSDQFSPPIAKRRRISDRIILVILLVTALVNGLVYLFLMPPWQHYDEPGHFEVAWLMASLNRRVQPGDYDAAFSRAVINSMIDHRFYGDAVVARPAQDEQAHIPTYQQLDEPPGYYLLASLPVRLVRLLGIEDVAGQLRAARFASLLLYIFTVLCAWGVSTEFTRPGHVMRWMVPLSIALLPGFADLMTAVNNDVGAVALVSFFLWGSVRLIQRKFSWINLVWVVAAAILAYFTKVTAYFILLLLPVVLLLAAARGRRARWLVWVALGLGLIGLMALSLTWGDAATWGRSTFQRGDTRQSAPAAPLGSQAFAIELPAGARTPQEYQLLQLIQLPAGESLKGQEVTVGAWMWASRPVQAVSPIFNTFPALKSASQTVQLTGSPQFVAYTYPVEGDATRNFISLAPLLQPEDQPVTVYYDGVVVVPGSWPIDEPPLFADESGLSGEWGDGSFQNLVRNPSAESSGPRLRSWVDAVGVRLLPDKGANQPSVTMYYFLDPAARQYQSESIRRLFQTQWTRFGWGQVPLLSEWPARLIIAAMLLGLGGAVIAVWRRRNTFPWQAALLFGLLLVGVWLQTFLRGANYATQLRAIYYPTARYAYPAIIPTMLLFNLGWYEIGWGLKVWLKLPGIVFSAVYVTAWVIYDLYAILSIYQYYYTLPG